jgi:preprotein translocase SecE subunit
MSTSEWPATGPANQKYIVMTFLGAAVLIGMSVRGLAIPLLAMVDMGDPLLFGLMNATLVAGLLAGVATFMILNRHPKAFGFTSETVDEFRKVKYPGKSETVRSTVVVLLFSIIVAGALAFYDVIWARVTNAFLFSEGL